MKILNGTLCALLLIALCLTSCKDDDQNQADIPTAEEFQNLRQTALENITQNFQFDPQSGMASLTSNQGVQIDIYSCTDASSNEATGMVDVEFVEIFDKGTMLVTNKPTMGISSSGEQGILISGGEFFINATESGEQLEACYIQAVIPAALTGGVNYNMSLWEGSIDADGDLTWMPIDSAGGMDADSSDYFVFINDLGWINCDIFYDDPRPRTDITVELPEGYDNGNSGVYFSIVGETSGLGTLGWQFPIGLECHIIFVTAEGTDWRYALASITVAENEVVTFGLDDTAVVTESELIDIINDLP